MQNLQKIILIFCQISYKKVVWTQINTISFHKTIFGREYMFSASKLTSIYTSHECKYDYASKHGAKDGLFILILVWLVHIVTKSKKLKIHL